MKQPWLLACLVFDRSSLVNGLWSFGFPLNPRSFILTKLLDYKTEVGEAVANIARVDRGILLITSTLSAIQNEART